MTRAYENFLRQYQAIGSEKADGYSRDVFEGLELQEKADVFKKLQSELPYTVDWLFLLDPAEAASIAKEKIHLWRGDPGKRVFLLQEAVIEHMGDLLYQEQMFQDYPHYADYLRPHAVRSISRTPSNVAKINFFKQVILVDANEEAVFEAADALLNMLGVPSSSDGEIQHYQYLQDRLCSQRVQDKLNAFTELEKYMSPDNS